MDSNPDTRNSLIVRMHDRDDNEAWAEFVQIYQPLVERFIQKHRLQYADAAEVTQEVLSRVARSIESWDPDHDKSSFRGWLYRITRNLTIDFLRRKQNEQHRIPIADPAVSQIADPGKVDSMEFQAEYERQLFQWAAERLKSSFKPVNWQAFWLSTIEGVPVEQVAEQLEIHCGAVYVARSRIMARMSKLIQQRLNETNLSLCEKDQGSND
ncbi:RNA polymerase sigma factor [Mariniblastus fucicola]|uniref:ECF RNA polymerase sigma factor SigE n=1 Tax=Mariniblastus fucicola TaxID=980251 RepID=A0A5B9PAG1_9BACT|nr:sigma-70 family RNA polymerase sigma factor [Mariniblastus fucicola]QEG21920.1 ECF RNA polymerase sigma factor SigE [Mariniblastus fucicola]